MATSGTTAFTLDLTEVVEEAFERAGAELRSGYDLRTARRSLNLLFADWANRGINLWTIEQGSVPLVAGTATYTLPVDTVDLLDHMVRTNDGVTALQTDISITRISMPTYSSIPNKLTEGRPIQLYIERLNTPQFTVWPVPETGSSYTLVYWRLRRIQDAGNGVNTMDMPFRFLPAMIAGLAYYLALKVPDGMARLDVLKQQYDEVWQLASGEDRERAAVRFVPRQAFIG